MREKEINKNHPDYKIMMEELKILQDDFLAKYDDLESKTSGVLLSYKLVPIRKEYFASIKALQKKYAHLYE